MNAYNLSIKSLRRLFSVMESIFDKIMKAKDENLTEFILNGEHLVEIPKEIFELEILQN